LSASSDLVGYSDWPGARQVFRIERHITTIKTKAIRTEVVYGITSLDPERATADQLLRLVRDHWLIENRSHWVRDVTFAEDASLVRVGAIPHVMATLRTTAIGLIRSTGTTRIAATCRRLAAHPADAVALLTQLLHF
jgi:hypothetical protein